MAGSAHSPGIKPDRHVEAEVACLRGDAAVLARYLRQPSPRRSVIESLALCLWADPTLSAECPENWKTGPGNRILRFAPKNGRPPKKDNAPAAAFDHSIEAAARALATGQAIPLARYLLAADKLSAKILHGFAEALDPTGTSEWRLKFGRPRRGNPRSPLRNDLVQAVRGLDALKKHDNEGISWDDIFWDPDHASDASETTIKKAVRKVRSAKLK